MFFVTIFFCKIWETMEYTIDYILSEDLKICQPKDNGFRFGTDSILLASFAKVKRNSHIADIGSGSGVIAAIIAKFYGSHVTAIEIQEEMHSCLLQTINLSNLQDYITPVLSDINIYSSSKRFDVIICNPPYRKPDTGHVSSSKIEMIARFTTCMDMQVMLKFCRRNLQHGGRLFFSYDADMLVDAISQCRQAGLEPKRLQFVYPSIEKGAKIVLIETVFGAGTELKIDPPIVQTGAVEVTKRYNDILSGKI